VKPIACSTCHGNGYTLTGMLCNCGIANKRALQSGFKYASIQLAELEQLRTENRALRESLDKVKQDAARYQWLRAGRMEFGNQDGPDKNTFWWEVDLAFEEADARIDAELAKESKPSKARVLQLIRRPE
jgi:hypothetical protein